MEIRQLKYFLAVAEQKSFINAANRLFVSRQAVSKAVAQLETELNVELFARNTNGAFLTPAGIMFYDRIRGSVADFDQIRTDMQQYGTRYRQMVRLAFSVGTISLFEKTLTEYSSSRKNMVIEYRECLESRCMELLLSRSCDIAICTTEPDDPLLTAQTLGTWRYGVLVREDDPVAALTEIPRKQLRQLRLACLQHGDNLLPAICTDWNLKPAFSGVDFYRLFHLVNTGKCALLLPERLVPEMPGVRWIPLERSPMWTLYLVHLQSQGNSVLYKTMLEEIQSATVAGLDQPE